MRIKRKILEILTKAIDTCLKEKLFYLKDIPPVIIEVPRLSKHGDYATNIAMLISSYAGISTKKIAELISARIEKEDVIEKVEIADPGFINIQLTKQVLYEVLHSIMRENGNYGKLELGKNKRVLLEYVSANPTGPLHIGHGRGAAVGDVLANILEFAGYEVEREYYINDMGNQMITLGKSVYLRYLELSGKKVDFPMNHYQGDYIKKIACEIKEEENGRYLEMPEEKAMPFFTNYASDYIFRGIKYDLEDFGIHFDNWYSERKVFEEGLVLEVIEELKAKGYIYEKDGAVWFQATRFGDEKDRVIIKVDGTPTYFATDIAYHKQKYERGFDLLINVWGADHHGYIPRIKAVIQALGKNPESFKVILVQLVNLLRDGNPVTMSTRTGEFTTLREVLDEVGKDAARYFFLMRRSDSHLDFDLELAKRQNEENPVYYVQYAHARICSIMDFAQSKGIDLCTIKEADLGLLNLPEELDLIKKLSHFPDLIESCAKTLEPHRLTVYLGELVSKFHAYYTEHRIVIDDLKLTRARLYLVSSIQQILKNALKLLGVSAPEKM